METDGLILAAGYSTRAGTHKMMLDMGGKTMLERCFESMADHCTRIVVVGGYRIENLRPVLSRYATVKLVFNKDFGLGMFSSLKEGLKHIKAERFFFTPGDYPFIQSNTYREMSEAAGRIIVPVFKDTRGHPLLMDSSYIDEILSSAVFTSLRDFLKTKPVTFKNVSDPGILIDIDTMADYMQFR